MDVSIPATVINLPCRTNSLRKVRRGTARRARLGLQVAPAPKFRIIVGSMTAPYPSPDQGTVRDKLPFGIKAVGVFLFFGATMALLAGTTLVWPGTIVDRIWLLNAPAYRQLGPLGKAVGIPFLILSGVMATAGSGWFARRLWGWSLAVVIIATQVFGDFVSMFMGHFVRGGVGLSIAGALLFYLFRPTVRAAFQNSKPPGLAE
jgi:hypothetical protein